MSWIKDNFFGGAAKDAAAVQVDSLEKAMGYQRESTQQARQDILGMFGPAYQDLVAGFQSAQDQIAQGRASTADIYNQATGQANQLLQQGTNASLSALLGRPVSTGNQMVPPAQQQVVQPPPMNVQSSLRGQLPQKTAVAQGVQAGLPTNQNGLPERSLLTNLQTAGTGVRNPLDAMAAGNEPDRFDGLRQNQSIMRQDPRDMYISPGMGIGGQGSIGNALRPGGRTTTIPTGAGALPASQQVTGQQVGQGQLSTPSDAAYMQTQDISATSLPALNMQQAPSIQTPDVSGIGLAGAEQAIVSGAQGAEQAIGGGLRGATNTFEQGLQGQLGVLSQAQQQANQLFGQSIEQTGQAGQQAISQIQQGAQDATGRFDPYSSAGQQALQREAAMSGALGADAQQQAVNSFMESPAQKYLREQAEKALLRNASATGGLRGGSTLAALQEQAIGISAQQQQQQLENLRNLAGRGQQAAGAQAGIDMQSGLSSAGVTQDISSQISGLRGSQAQMGAQFGQLGANAIGQTAGNIGQMQFGTGQQLGSLRQGVGSQLGSLRMGVGQQVAGQLGQLGANMANNQLNLGQQLGGLDQTTISNLANLLQNQGQQGFASRMQLAQILANLATGQGSNLANLQSQIGSAAAGGITGQAAGLQQGVGTVAGLAAGFGALGGAGAGVGSPFTA